MALVQGESSERSATAPVGLIPSQPLVTWTTTSPRSRPDSSGKSRASGLLSRCGRRRVHQQTVRWRSPLAWLSRRKRCKNGSRPSSSTSPEPRAVAACIWACCPRALQTPRRSLAAGQGRFKNFDCECANAPTSKWAAASGVTHWHGQWCAGCQALPRAVQGQVSVWPLHLGCAARTARVTSHSGASRKQFQQHPAYTKCAQISVSKDMI